MFNFSLCFSYIYVSEQFYRWRNKGLCHPNPNISNKRFGEGRRRVADVRSRLLVRCESGDLFYRLGVSSVGSWVDWRCTRKSCDSRNNCKLPNSWIVFHPCCYKRHDLILCYGCVVFHGCTCLVLQILYVLWTKQFEDSFFCLRNSHLGRQFVPQRLIRKLVSGKAPVSAILCWHISTSSSRK